MTGTNRLGERREIFETDFSLAEVANVGALDILREDIILTLWVLSTECWLVRGVEVGRGPFAFDSDRLIPLPCQDEVQLMASALCQAFCYNVVMLLHRRTEGHGHYKNVEPRL